MIFTRSFAATTLGLILAGWLVGLHGKAGATEHYARAFGVLTKEQGREAPVFTLKDLAGKVHRLKDYQGKVVLLGFGATW